MTWSASPPPPLGAHDVHVWRIASGACDIDALNEELSPDERERAQRFHYEEHQRHYIAAHGMLRRILGAYVGTSPRELVFTTGQYGKPALSSHQLEFNLSHSGDYALVAVAHAPVGVDVEAWRTGVEYFSVADYVFSPLERETLRSLEAAEEQVIRGFYNAWSRKEAYIKALGDGITQGLDHFDVSMIPDAIAELLADRRDHTATTRWRLYELNVASGYSAAVVCTAPVEQLLLFEAPTSHS